MFAIYIPLQVRIPRSAASRRAGTWALLIRRISPRAGSGIRIFEGTYFKPGEIVSVADLRPTPRYPVTPLLVEYAGTTGLDARGRPARGHNRALDVRFLWRFDQKRGEFREIARILSEGPEWFGHFEPIVRRELVLPPTNHVQEARMASARVLAALDHELHELDADEARSRVLSFLYDQVTARLVAA